jgi:hypothetical protein
MNEAFIFIFGLIATILAVGPLALAGILEYMEKNNDQ